MTTNKPDFDKDSWRTPKYFFNWVHNRFGWINIDGCATYDNALSHYYIGNPSAREETEVEHTCLADDFLSENLLEVLLEHVVDTCTAPLRIFVNPPYSDVTPFLIQAKRICNAGHFVVMLLNNDKSTQWYQEHVHNVANEVIEIVGGRIAFIHPVTGEEVKGNSKWQMVVVFDPTMEDFVQRSVSLDFVKKVGGYER